jgi:hypothetical protein
MDIEFKVTILSPHPKKPVVRQDSKMDGEERQNI